MTEFVEFVPSGVCTKKITFEFEGGKMYNLKFEGGCPGNLEAISRLLEGAVAWKAAEMLRGNRCGKSETSCADQLAIAIEQALIRQSAKRKAS